ncbi:hypothetical protein ABKY54_004540 [Vibrio harveyi]
MMAYEKRPVYELSALATEKCFNNGFLVGEDTETTWCVSESLVEYAIKNKKQLSEFVPPHLEILEDIPVLDFGEEKKDDDEDELTAIVLAAAKKLNVDDDDLWYANGGPKLGAVNKILETLGHKKVSKVVLDAACGDFKRPEKEEA